MPYNLTQFPYLLNHRTHFKAIAVVKEFRAVVFSKCSPLFRLFVCSILAPPCDGYQKSTPPCQQLSLKASSNQAQDYIAICHAVLALTREGHVKVFESIIHSKSQELQHHQCLNLLPPPHRAQFPNYYGHVSGKEARASFEQLYGILQIASPGDGCSFLLAQFPCRLHVPPCRETTLPLPPCRELSLQAKSQRKRIIGHHRFQWPADHKCIQFPRGSLL